MDSLSSFKNLAPGFFLRYSFFVHDKPCSTRDFNILSLLIAAIAIFVVLFSIYRSLASSPKGISLTAFAECLSENDATMYGTDVCPYCQQQKTLFGDAFKKISYINCDFHAATCRAAKIRSYPTWHVGDRALSPGIQTFQELSLATSCKPPTV